MDCPHRHATLQHKLLVHGIAHQLDKQPGLKRFAHQRKFQFDSHRTTPCQIEVHIADMYGDSCFNYSSHNSRRHT
jgi:hypothetical protein